MAGGGVHQWGGGSTQHWRGYPDQRCMQPVHKNLITPCANSSRISETIFPQIEQKQDRPTACDPQTDGLLVN